MEEQILEHFPTLPPHKYPFWLKLFGCGIIIATLYSFISLPEYFIAAKNMSAAQLAYQSGNYYNSIRFYKYVVKAIPSSKVARIGLAEAAFSTNDRNNHIIGLSALEDIVLNKYDWSRLIKVMPIEYQKYFDEVKE